MMIHPGWRPTAISPHFLHATPARLPRCVDRNKVGIMENTSACVPARSPAGNAIKVSSSSSLSASESRGAPV
eukprot:9490735-Pyramimonas_sp.AAC.1